MQNKAFRNLATKAFENPQKYFYSILVLFDVVLSALILLFYKLTDIDWSTYIAQVSQVSSGVRKYTDIEGPTGPIVYPAGHVWFYTLLSRFTLNGEKVAFAQIAFTLLYFSALLITIKINRLTNVPILMTSLLVLSRRIHSIYMLRCFNDCINTVFFLASLIFFVKKRTYVATGLYRRVLKFILFCIDENFYA
jgi:alpha-1,3-mannosyltransferase